MTAGSARKASADVAAVAVPNPIGDIDAAIAPSAARAAAAPHAIANTVPTLIPWASAASWSNATARMATPRRVRKNRKMARNASAAHTMAKIHDQ